MTRASEGGPAIRRAIRVRGTVQGVGFRPTVFRLARALALGGLVRNDGEGVWIEVEGEASRVARFVERLGSEAPPLSRIDAVEATERLPSGERDFRIVATVSEAAARTLVPPDAAPCADCLRELRDARDRRHRYPFVNCTSCGPRYTIVRALPYDRAATTMAAFALCPTCAGEYGDAATRRFHAEPNACPTCGPRLRLLEPGRDELRDEAALERAARAISEGAIVAVKGVGGFLLAVDAANEAAVARLRERKRRPHKPLALMARDLAAALRAVVLDDATRAALLSPARPIVLAPARPHAAVAPSVAPGMHQLGLMLPSTPLHQLLLDAGPPLQVMTSGNRSEEPIAKDDATALARLGAIADAFLLHDRAIHTRADDSVVRLVLGATQPVRRARGFVPEPIALPSACDGAPTVLAVGAQIKGTICLTRDGAAYLSQHLGDLDHPECFDLFVETIGKLGRLLDVRPSTVAHDLHPDYRSTRWALGAGLPRVPVQHHHAHVAACLAEHGRAGPALGVAFDGTGCGPDGELWGGEFLVAGLDDFHRAAHLSPLPLPGGEAAIRAPWRLAASALLDAGEPLDLLARIGGRRLEAMRRLVAGRLGAPASTGAGRWFDAIAALCALRDEITYEGQAAIELEAAADGTSGEPYPFSIEDDGGPLRVSLRPTVRAIAAELRAGAAASSIAARFHETMAAAVVQTCRRLRERGAPSTVALSGGCFQSARLTERSAAGLLRLGFEVLVHRRVPPNDGGLALGQAAVAAFRTQRRRREGSIDVPRHPR